MIKKDTLIQFIDKSSVGNAIKSVNWKVSAADKTLKTRGQMENKSFIMSVTFNNFTEFVDDVRIPIASTEKLKDFLSAFGDDINLTLNKDKDRILGFFISNNDCEQYFTAAEPSVIPPAPKDDTDKHIYDVQIALTDEFVNCILKSQVAHEKHENAKRVMIRMGKNDKVEFVIGNADANTNRMRLNAPTINGKDKFDGPPINFPVDNLIAILKSNKDVSDGIFYLKTEGMFKVSYKTEHFDCQYWQLAYSKNK